MTNGEHHDHPDHPLPMGSRGVSRPMAEHAIQQHHEEHHGEGHGAPYSGARYDMLRMHHQQTLWVYWTLILLGIWTVTAPFNFGYLNENLWVEPSGERGPWFSDELHTALRAWLMTWSDLISGALLVILGWRSLRPDRPVSVWLAAGVGAWLSAAPLLFWSPIASAYVNGTIVGMLVLSLTILIPGMPNMIVFMRMGGDKPPGWTYNPSSWIQRVPMIGLAFAGLLASRYLAMYQLGYIQGVWDPFFGSSSEQVLDSDLSHALPVSDAGLGALAYTFEFLMGFMGASSRWRTMPWMVALFGLLVIPLGLVHILLVISQPVVVGAWCTFCLLAAAIMLPMIPLEVDEVVAMIQHVRQTMKKEGFWKVFWKGGDPSRAEEDDRTPPVKLFGESPRRALEASAWGMSIPWTLALSAFVGVIVMAIPGAFDVVKPMSSYFHLGGALVTVTAVVAMGEPIRISRYFNVLVGLALAIGPWFAEGGDVVVRVIGLAAGAAVIALALPRGPVRDSYGNLQLFG